MEDKELADKELKDKVGKMFLFFLIFLGIPMFFLIISLAKEEAKEIRYIKDYDYEKLYFKVVKIDDKPLARYVYLASENDEIYLANFKKTAKFDIFENTVGQVLTVNYNKDTEKYYLVYYKVQYGEIHEDSKELTYLKNGLPK